MRAIQMHEHGGPEVLRLTELPDPVPGPGEVLVQSAASGVHLVETTVRRGGDAIPPHLRPTLPYIPGREVAGVAVAVGDGVDPGLVGRRVVANTSAGAGGGGYAELAAVPLALLHRVPGTLDDAAAVALLGTGRTAMRTADVARIVPGDVVLVLAAAGGIGALLVGRARTLGARAVAGAAGPAKVAVVAGLGADVAVDYCRGGWDDELRDALGDHAATVVIDSVGGDVGRRALTLLAPGGRQVVVGWSGGEPTTASAADLAERGVELRAVVGPGGGPPTPDEAYDLAARALAEGAAGRFTPLVGTPFALARAADAHRALEGRATTGKVVLVP